MHAVHIVMNDIVDHADMRRNQPTWHVKVGLGAINDALIMETCIQKLLEKHFKLKNCYVELMNIFWKVSKIFFYLYYLHSIQRINCIYKLILYTRKKTKTITFCCIVSIFKKIIVKSFDN